ncbi:hypothetical protein BV20DRAFT_626100 [Pilatotrama ljubarskyi]|nr:hypothetical protein BV20DRAFT_626100 [Pilatotrama ljubarskyi]
MDYGPFDRSGPPPAHPDDGRFTRQAGDGDPLSMQAVPSSGNDMFPGLNLPSSHFPEASHTAYDPVSELLAVLGAPGYWHNAFRIPLVSAGSETLPDAGPHGVGGCASIGILPGPGPPSQQAYYLADPGACPGTLPPVPQPLLFPGIPSPPDHWQHGSAVMSPGSYLGPDMAMNGPYYLDTQYASDPASTFRRCTALTPEDRSPGDHGFYPSTPSMTFSSPGGSSYSLDSPYPSPHSEQPEWPSPNMHSAADVVGPTKMYVAPDGYVHLYAQEEEVDKKGNLHKYYICRLDPQLECNKPYKYCRNLYAHQRKPPHNLNFKFSICVDCQRPYKDKRSRDKHRRQKHTAPGDLREGCNEPVRPAFSYLSRLWIAQTDACRSEPLHF